MTRASQPDQSVIVASIGVDGTREYFVSALVLVSIIAAVLVAIGFPLYSTFLALILLAICIYPTFEYFSKGLMGIPTIPVILGAYGLQYAVPALVGNRLLALVGGTLEISEDSLIWALLVAIVGAVTLLVVCNAKIVNRAINKLPQLNLHLNPTKAVIFCAVFGTIAMGLSVFLPDFDPLVQSQLSALIRTLHNQILVVIAILGWLAATKRTPAITICWYGAIAIATAEGASGAMLESAFAPIGIMFMCEWIYLRKVRKVLLVLVAGGFLFLNAVKGDVRETLWHGAGTDASRVERALFWTNTAADFWSDVIQGRARGDVATEQLISRANLIDLLAHVSEQSPDPIRYLNGESYTLFMYAWIPRFIWPEKPEATANRLLAVNYNITTAEGAEVSTFGIGLIGEGYANFGVFGVILAMAILGINLLAMIRLFGTMVSGPGGIAIFLSVFVYFLNGLGSSAEILFGNLFQSMLASYVLLFWARSRPTERVLT